MQELKISQKTNRFMDSHTSFLTEDKLITKKKHENLQQIEPWLQQPDSNPFINLRSKQLKVKKDSPRVKRVSSLQLNNQWKSIEKVVQNRQSKILPVMDIGQLNCIKKSYSNPKLKIKMDYIPNSERDSVKKGSRIQLLLPSVKRELIIQRKIFLMKNFGNSSPNSSPMKSSRIRNIIDQNKI